jgi:carbamoyltransferase
MTYFNYCSGLTMTHPRLHKLFGGPPRKPESRLTQREMDLARSVQDVIEMAVISLAKAARTATGSDSLCLAGGVALNCVANGKLLRENLFRDIWIQPAAGDAGGALGAALAVWHEYAGNPRTADGIRDCQKGSLLGPGSRIARSGTFSREGYPQGVGRCRADRYGGELLADGKVWLVPGPDGVRAQGPGQPQHHRRRAQRADAGQDEPEDQIPESFRLRPPCWPKRRLLRIPGSPYRGRRPEELRVRGQRLWGIGCCGCVPPFRRDSVDYSARIQTVHRDTNPKFYALLSEFQRITGCPVLVNTSFNVRGEPLVCSPEDAYLCFMRTGMDALVIGNRLLIKEGQPAFEEDDDWRKKFQLD